MSGGNVIQGLCGQQERKPGRSASNDFLLLLKNGHSSKVALPSEVAVAEFARPANIYGSGAPRELGRTGPKMRVIERFPMQSWLRIAQDWRFLAVLFAVIAVGISLDKYARGEMIVHGHPATRYNNYVISLNAFHHLVQGQDLYQWYPEEQWDLFKYSPTFALAMAPLAQLPDIVGLCLWNAGTALCLLWGLRSLPVSTQASAGMAWIVLKDLLTNLQNAQSNALVAALMVLTIAYWEKQRLFAAATALALSFYIKIFGVAVVLLWVLYPQKARSAAWIAGVGLALALPPLLVTSPGMLYEQYQNWGRMLSEDHAASLGDSVMGMLEAMFGLRGHKVATVLIGGLIFLAPLARLSQYGNPKFRLGLLASTLLFVVLFNHKAESPTFIIAACGTAVWFCTRPVTKLNIGLLAFAIVLTGFSSSDLFPNWIQEQWFAPYHVKALPCLAVWLKLQWDLWQEPAVTAAAASPATMSAPYLRAA
jgi:hypothetical protein